MARDAFVLKIQRALCHPKTFGTFKTETGPGARTLLYAGTTQSHVPCDLLIITAADERKRTSLSICCNRSTPEQQHKSRVSSLPSRLKLDADKVMWNHAAVSFGAKKWPRCRLKPAEFPNGFGNAF